MHIKNAEEIDHLDTFLKTVLDEYDYEDEDEFKEIVNLFQKQIDYFVQNKGNYVLFESNFLIINNSNEIDSLKQFESFLLHESVSTIFNMYTSPINNFILMLRDLQDNVELEEDDENLIKEDLYDSYFKRDNPSEWAVEEVVRAVNNNITFDEILEDFSRDITREEFCMLIINSYESITNETAPLPSSNVFIDTNNPHILKAYNLGIVLGVSANEFAPNATITREQMAVMLYQMLKNIDPLIKYEQHEVLFDDKDTISSWALEAVAYCSNTGIIKGVGNNMFSPKSNATREQGIILVSLITNRYK